MYFEGGARPTIQYPSSGNVFHGGGGGCCFQPPKLKIQTLPNPLGNTFPVPGVPTRDYCISWGGAPKMAIGPVPGKSSRVASGQPDPA